MKNHHFYKWMPVLLLAFFSLGEVNAQKKVIENGAIFKFERKHMFHFPKRVSGAIVADSGKVKFVETRYRGIVALSLDSVRKIYMPEDIILFENDSYHYKNGTMQSFLMGFGDFHFNMDYTASERLRNNWQLGIGAGMHVNMLEFYTPTSNHLIEVLSFPIYGEARYFFTNWARRPYLKGRAGWVNNVRNWNARRMKNGVMGEFGIGVVFASKWRRRMFMEMSQYTSYAAGVARISDPNILSDVEFSNWFNRFLITFGVELGK